MRSARLCIVMKFMQRAPSQYPFKTVSYLLAIYLRTVFLLAPN